MPSLAVSSTVDGRQLCCRILGVIGLRDTGTFINNNMVKLRVSIELDKPAVKVVEHVFITLLSASCVSSTW